VLRLGCRHRRKIALRCRRAVELSAANALAARCAVAAAEASAIVVVTAAALDEGASSRRVRRGKERHEPRPLLEPVGRGCHGQRATAAATAAAELPAVAPPRRGVGAMGVERHVAVPFRGRAEQVTPEGEVNPTVQPPAHLFLAAPKGAQRR
jgi:hypothetical protein